MEMFLIIAIVVGIWVYHKATEYQADQHIREHDIDIQKMTTDRILNNLSNAQVDRNTINGKYDK